MFILKISYQLRDILLQRVHLCTFIFKYTDFMEIIMHIKMMSFTNIYIVWLSLMRVTDWLNTLTWLQHNLVCSLPQGCGGGTLIDTTKCFHLGKFFHANKWQNELAILSLQKCMLTALDRALAVYCAHSTIDTHCTARNLKKISTEKNYWAM